MHVSLGPLMLFAAVMSLTPGPNVIMVTASAANFGFGRTVPQMFGITIGFHRLFTHRSFDTYRPIRYLFAVLGSMAVEGPVITWVADHRKHHAFADEDGDPHSPHTTHGVGPVAMVKGLWHAHIGWMFIAVGRADRMRYAPDLMKDRVLRAISAGFLPIFFISLAVPFALVAVAQNTGAKPFTAFSYDYTPGNARKQTVKSESPVSYIKLPPPPADGSPLTVTNTSDRKVYATVAVRATGLE